VRVVACCKSGLRVVEDSAVTQQARYRDRTRATRTRTDGGDLTSGEIGLTLGTTFIGLKQKRKWPGVRRNWPNVGPNEPIFTFLA